MAGELWRATAEIGKEVTAGTAVAATRKAYLIDPVITDTREPRPKRFAVGRRDNVLSVPRGPSQVAGSASMDMSSDELIEWLLVTLKGGVTPTTPGGATNARLWTFVPGATALDSLTMRYNDGANPWVAAGIRGDRMTIDGSVEGDNTVALELFGQSKVAGALTGGLTDRDINYMLGWQTNLYIEALGGTPGTTQLSTSMLNWHVEIGNGLARRYYANNSQNAGAIAISELDVTAQITFEASDAAALTEFNNWNSDTSRLVRLEFLGPLDGIEVGFRRFVTIDLPGVWTTPDFAGSDGPVRTYQFGLQYRYDSTNGYGLQVRAQNARTAAF